MKQPQRISVTSGKGGVGKTLTTVNLAVAARRLGYSVLIFDGDLGLANVDVVLGMRARYNIRDVLDGHAELRDVIVEGPLGIALIPSGSGISSLTQLTYAQKQIVFEQIERVNHVYDVLLIDTGAGISDNVVHLNNAAEQMLVVTTPEPHAMTDAYALIKVMAEETGRKSCDLLVNQTRSADEGLKIADRMAEVSMRFLNVQVNFVGHVPFDPQVSKQVMQRRAASEQSTHTIAGQAWAQVARKLLMGSQPTAGAQQSSKQGGNGDVHDFLQHLLRAEPTGRLQAGF